MHVGLRLGIDTCGLQVAALDLLGTWHDTSHHNLHALSGKLKLDSHGKIKL